MPARVLLVGSGITSSLTSTFIKKKVKDSLYLEVWDKAKGVGGRMSTSRSTTCISSKVDLGAQYITALPEEFLKNQELYESLLSSNVLEPLNANVEGMKLFPAGTKHFVAPNGMNSVVRHFLQYDEIKFEHHVTAISQHENKVLVQTKGGDKDLFDAVILTMPVPQILEITKGMPLHSELLNALKRVRYSSRYALGLFYDTPNTAFNVPWDAKYIDNCVFRFIAFDNRKRNRKYEPDACVFHTSVRYGYENIDCSIEDMKEKLLDHVKQMFPTWPKPVHVKCQKWRYSQVIEPYLNKPGYVVLASSPLVLAGGDGFIESNFSGCLFSASKLAEVAVDMINSI
ncbi:renalase-like [Anabrus simplex]|uniref:renalase-like n=1 Tax=Anabrus simplex TaxID=316456 RepID=UPI0035A2E72D